jgi:hypothetical protein
LSLDITACYEFDLTGYLKIPVASLVQRADALLHFRATINNLATVIDLSDVDEIKVSARERYNQFGLPIFTATLANSKISIIDAAEGLFDVALTRLDTDFAGMAVIQVLYHLIDGRVLMGPVHDIAFLPTYLTSDIVNPEDPEVPNFALYSCTLATEVGDLVYQTSTPDLVAQADASDLSKIDVIGWVAEKPTTTTCKVTNDVGPVPSSGLTAGDRLYLSDTAPGKVTSLAPVSPSAEVEIGIARDLDEFVFTGAKIII